MFHEERDNKGKYALTEHPCNHVPSQTEYEDQGLKTVDGSQHNDTERRDGASVVDDDVEKITQLYESRTVNLDIVAPEVCARLT